MSRLKFSELGGMRYCDFTCQYAQAPEQLADGSRSCMTFTGIWCAQLERLVYKSSVCKWEREEAKRGPNKGMVAETDKM